MDVSRPRTLLAITLAFGLATMSSSRVHADPFYTMTELGAAGYDELHYSPDGQSVITNIVTGVSYPFRDAVTPAPSNWEADPAWNHLPGIWSVQGVINPEEEYFPMRPIAANSSGTVIGEVPSGQSLGVPWSTPAYAYVQKQADGQYGPVHFLAPAQQLSIFSLNGNNQIIYTTGFGQTQILDLNSHASTSYVLPPLPPNVPKDWTIFPYAIADDGSIFAQVDSNQYNAFEILLTPPGLGNPTPVPEPTTFAAFLAGLLTWALRWRSKRKTT